MVDTRDMNYYSKLEREGITASLSLPKVATGRNRGSAKRLWREHELVKIQTVLQKARETTTEDSGIAVPKFIKQITLQPVHSVPMYKVLHAPSNYGTKNHDLRNLYASAVNLVNEARNVEDRSSYKSLKSMHKIHKRGYTVPPPLSGKLNRNKIVWESSTRAMTCPGKFINATKDNSDQKSAYRTTNTPATNKDELFTKRPTFLELYGKNRQKNPAASELSPVTPRLILSRKEERRIVKYTTVSHNHHPAEKSHANITSIETLTKEHDKISLGDQQSVRSFASSGKCSSLKGKSVSEKNEEIPTSRASGKSVSSKGESGGRIVSIQDMKIDGNQYRKTPSVHIPIAPNGSETETQYAATTEHPITDLAETSSKISQVKNTKNEPAIETEPIENKDQAQEEVKEQVQEEVVGSKSDARQENAEPEEGPEKSETLLNQTTIIGASVKQDEDGMSKTEYTRNIDDAIPNTPGIPEEKIDEELENVETAGIVENNIIETKYENADNEKVEEIPKEEKSDEEKSPECEEEMVTDITKE